MVLMGMGLLVTDPAFEKEGAHLCVIFKLTDFDFDIKKKS